MKRPNVYLLDANNERINRQPLRFDGSKYDISEYQGFVIYGYELEPCVLVYKFDTNQLKVKT